MWLRKEQGGAGVAGYHWDNDGDVVEVDDALADKLLAIRGGGYSVALGPKGAETAKDDGDDESGGGDEKPPAYVPPEGAKVANKPPPKTVTAPR